MLFTALPTWQAGWQKISMECRQIGPGQPPTQPHKLLAVVAVELAEARLKASEPISLVRTDFGINLRPLGG